jgi:AcrR family transcriptional regulator
MSVAELERLRAPRPHRADAARNYDAVLDAAREVFGEYDLEAPIEEVARRAGVGIATVYRNFPTRDSLIENVYLHEVEAVCAAAVEAAAQDPAEGITTWLQRFVDYVATKRIVSGALNRDSEIYRACAQALAEAGEPLLSAAQQAGVMRDDVDIDDVMRYLIGSAAVNFVSDKQRYRMFNVLLDGLRATAEHKTRDRLASTRAVRARQR